MELGRRAPRNLASDLRSLGPALRSGDAHLRWRPRSPPAHCAPGTAGSLSGETVWRVNRCRFEGRRVRHILVLDRYGRRVCGLLGLSDLVKSAANFRVRMRPRAVKCIRSATMTAAGEATYNAIRASGRSIYDDLSDAPELIYDIADLEGRLNHLLAGEVWNYPIRTRSKVAKQAVTAALGYPVPRSFQKTQPRFPGQNLDISVQMADNLQIWNEEVDPDRRYALIRVLNEGTVTRVRVVTGEVIALWDRTGTLTSKYQAKRIDPSQGSKLVSPRDTENFMRAFAPSTVPPFMRAATSPTHPNPGSRPAMRQPDPSGRVKETPDPPEMGRAPLNEGQHHPPDITPTIGHAPRCYECPGS